jgi:hypothetical protein
MKENNVNDSSTLESGNEDFRWVREQNFSKKLKKLYTQFPLKTWKDIVLDSKSPQIKVEGLYYQSTVNKVLKKDIFKEFDFHEEKDSAIDFRFKDVYRVDFDKLHKKNISPDFYVYKMENKKFFDLLQSRKYMMILHNENKIPKEKKFISILGEIKSSYYSCHIDDLQRIDYQTFAQLVNESEGEEFIVLMYIYDNSFNFFERDYNNNYPQDEIPIIYAYVPKLYYENCYDSYNELIDLFQMNKEKINLNEKIKFKKKRKELEKELDIINEKYERLLKSKKLSPLTIIIGLFLMIFFAYVINKIIFINFNN